MNQSLIQSGTMLRYSFWWGVFFFPYMHTVAAKSSAFMHNPLSGYFKRSTLLNYGDCSKLVG